MTRGWNWGSNEDVTCCSGEVFAPEGACPLLRSWSADSAGNWEDGTTSHQPQLIVLPSFYSVSVSTSVLWVLLYAFNYCIFVCLLYFILYWHRYYKQRANEDLQKIFQIHVQHSSDFNKHSLVTHTLFIQKPYILTQQHFTASQHILVLPCVPGWFCTLYSSSTCLGCRK